MCHGTREHHARAEGESCGCAPQARHERSPHHHYAPGDDFTGGFGVRRPLRFLAWKLELTEPQVTRFAAIINELKTERAQAAVDDRRALTLLAEAASGEAFDTARAAEATKLRLESGTRLQHCVTVSLAAMHAVLEPEQRTRLAYLLQTGTLVM
jgi:Spy/CpxP family protein refolding chaperone